VNDLVRDVMRVAQQAAVQVMNAQRANVKDLDYVQIRLPQEMPALPSRRNIIQERLIPGTSPPLTLYELHEMFERVAKDPRPKGVILQLRGFNMRLADLQTLRDSILWLRERGKRVVAFGQSLTLPDYYIASACDDILIQPGGSLIVTGLALQQTYLRDGLEYVGVQFDPVQITPYKTAPDTLARQEPSPEGAEMMNWLVDSQFDQYVQGIAQGRGLSTDEVRAMIDEGAFTDQAALEAGHISGLCNEEGLAGYLGVHHVVLLDKAKNLLFEEAPSASDKYVALLRVGGSIITGESSNPPIDFPIPFVGGERMGDLTVTQQIRNLMKDERLGALVLFVDSGGGSADASEAMASALDELAKKVPVVVFMNNVAASGGYYIATPADWIVAQPGTITGSIGVLAAKAVTNEAFKKLRFNPVWYTRGEKATMFTTDKPFTDAERQKIREYIESVYRVFIDRVAASRKMKPEQVDKVAGGRVWTGAQALEHGLVDQLGGVQAAISKARELAKLGPDTPVNIVYGKGKPLPAQVAEQADPAATLRYLLDGVDHITTGAQMMMPYEWK